jgi:hypothetical protein
MAQRPTPRRTTPPPPSSDHRLVSYQARSAGSARRAGIGGGSGCSECGARSCADQCAVGRSCVLWWAGVGLDGRSGGDVGGGSRQRRAAALGKGMRRSGHDLCGSGGDAAVYLACCGVSSGFFLCCGLVRGGLFVGLVCFCGVGGGSSVGGPIHALEGGRARRWKSGWEVRRRGWHSRHRILLWPQSSRWNSNDRGARKCASTWTSPQAWVRYHQIHWPYSRWTVQYFDTLTRPRKLHVKTPRIDGRRLARPRPA